MNWKIKACIQNVVHLLPESLSNQCYFLIQKYFGGLRIPEPISKIKTALGLIRDIRKLGETPKDRVFFEVGTGRDLTIPFILRLFGAKKVVTVDKNPYLVASFVQDNFSSILVSQGNIRELLRAEEGGEEACRSLDSLLGVLPHVHSVNASNIE